MGPVAEPFRLLLRVRYGECDPQGIVFNARYGDYLDVAACEYCRALFGGVDASTGIDWRLVRQLTEWKAPARFDDVLEIHVVTRAVGTTSFTLGFEARRFPSGPTLVTSVTVYVVVDPRTGQKLPVPERHREALVTGAAGMLVDQAAVGVP